MAAHRGGDHYARTDIRGVPARFVMARDVTDQLRVERALESRETYYRALIENALDIITVVDRDGKILFESPALYRVLGYRPEYALGKASSI